MRRVCDDAKPLSPLFERLTFRKRSASSNARMLQFLSEVLAERPGLASGMEEIDKEDSEVMVLARLLCDKIHDAGDCPSPELMKSLREELSQLSLLVQRNVRHNSAQRARWLSEKDIMRAEMHGEQVDREANSARIADRQRFLFERAVAQSGQSTAAEKAVASAAYVEAALASLCPHVGNTSPGSAQLAEAAGGCS